VGSIGAIMRLNDATSLANRFGVREISYRTAPLKGGPSLISGQSEVEAEAMQVLVDEAGKIFLRDVLAQRKDKLKVDESTLYSGNIWTAEQALEMGLIDGVGVLDSLRDTLFEGRDLHRYTTKQSIAEQLGLKSLVQQVLADAQGIRLQ
jgi:protease-4